MMLHPNIKDLMLDLVLLGYRYHAPSGKTWHSAFLLKKSGNMLCVLFRKRGIDVRWYEGYISGSAYLKDGKLHMAGGVLYRNHYNESSVSIKHKIHSICRRYAEQGTLEEKDKVEHGRGFMLSPGYPSAKSKGKTEWYRKMIEYNILRSGWKPASNRASFAPRAALKKCKD